MQCYALEYLDGRLVPHGPSPAAEDHMKPHVTSVSQDVGQPLGLVRAASTG